MAQLGTQVDKKHLTPTTPNATYLPVALDGQLIHSMFDTGSNIALLKHKLVKQLGLEVHAYLNTYQVASGI